MKKIVIISTVQPSMNPRVVKEADALVEEGYEVIVLYAYRINWATKVDERIFKNSNWKAIKCGGDPGNQRIRYAYTRLRRKISQRFIKLDVFRKRYFAQSYDETLKEAIRLKAD